MSDKLLTLNEWKDEFEPVLEFDEETKEEGDILFYETYEPHIGSMKEYAEKLAKASGAKFYQHIWSRVDGDGGKLILLNGWHRCNRLDYCLSSIPWGDGSDEDKDIYIEVTY